MTVIKAPYNFVPFNKEVVTPHWIDQISHDIPFKDGLSGKIEVKLTAMSPIFVRDGVGQNSAKAFKNDQGEQVEAYTFSQTPDGKYFIPGTSLKGMIRSVLEILSFGRMEGKVTDRRISFRDLSDPMKTIYREHFKVGSVYGGWLRKTEEGKYVIDSYSLPGRISHEEIDKGLDLKFSSYFSVEGDYDGKKDEDKAAKKKYDFAEGVSLKREFSFLVQKPGGRLYRIEEGGEEEGTLVFTGQPSVGKHQKRLEFIFWKSQTSIEVEQEVMQGFFDAYFEYDKNRWSIDWENRRKELDNGKPIPVFFQKESANNKDRVKHLGLSFLYKLPGKSSILQAINRQQKGEEKPDLSEAIFGHVLDSKEQLRGRVHIGHAFAIDELIEDTEKSEVLANPKPSFFPNYISQENGRSGRTTSYSTLRDDAPEISGWKRYPVLHKDIKHNPKPVDAKSDKISTKFRPLTKESAFSFNISYHNLRPVELGALLSALTFHNCPDAHHNIGMGKPLGYGKVKLEIASEVEVKPNNSQDSILSSTNNLMGTFEAYMNASLGFNSPEWHNTSQVKELIAMAVGKDYSGPPYLSPDQHREVRNHGEYLEPYSKLNPETTRNIRTMTSTDEITQILSATNREQECIRFQDTYSTEIENHLKEIHEQKYSLFKKWKEAQISFIKKYIKTIKNAEDASSGPKWNEVDMNNPRNSFNSLKKAVEDFGKKMEGHNNIKLILQKFPDGYLPEEYHSRIIEILSDIFERQAKGEKDKWMAPFEKNPLIKKAAEWIGEQKAQGFIQRIQS